MDALHHAISTSQRLLAAGLQYEELVTPGQTHERLKGHFHSYSCTTKDTALLIAWTNRPELLELCRALD